MARISGIAPTFRDGPPSRGAPGLAECAGFGRSRHHVPARNDPGREDSLCPTRQVRRFSLHAAERLIVAFGPIGAPRRALQDRLQFGSPLLAARPRAPILAEECPRL